MSEEYSNGYARGYEAGQQSVLKLAEQPAQQEPVAWVHWLHGPVRLLLNKDEAQMELERLNREYPVDAGSRKMRPLVFGDTPPPAQRKPLTDDEMDNCLRRAGVIATLEALRCIGREVEAAHNIKENT